MLMQLCQRISVSDGTSYWEEIGTFSSAWLGGIQSTFRNLENHLNNSGDFQQDGAGYLFREKVEDDNSERQATINKLISELGKQNQLYALSRGDLESTAFHIAKIQEKEAALLKAINS